jgi:hypothetical protein
VVLGFELRVSCLLGRHLSHTFVSFCFGSFRDRVSLYAWVGLDCDPPSYASCIVGITGVHHHAQLLRFFFDVFTALPFVVTGCVANYCVLITLCCMIQYIR